jgi:thermostable 8-oxoguanine DNA glycosylase
MLYIESMINERPFDVKSPDPHTTLTQEQLERFLLFAVAVAGKRATMIEKALDKFLAMDKGGTPFGRVRHMVGNGTLRINLQRAHLGRYDVLTKSYKQIVTSGINLRMCTLEDLRKFHGVGPKTSRFFLLHSRLNLRMAVLDTHILKYLQKIHPERVIPKSTPTSPKQYDELERLWLAACDLMCLSSVEADSMVWKYYANAVENQRTTEEERTDDSGIQ